MKTTETETRMKPAAMLCRMISMPIKHWVTAMAFILFFVVLCAVVFAGEPVHRAGILWKNGPHGD